MVFELVSIIIGCLVLFIFSIKRLSEIFTDLFTDKATKLIARSTSSIWRSILTGIIVTILLDSSSAVIILAIVFINAKKLNLKGGIGIALGANIGTTFQSQLFAFDFMQYSFVLLVIGVFHLFVQNEKKRNVLLVVLYLGFLFFSLFLIENTVSRPEMYAKIETWITTSQRSPLRSAITGGLGTLIIQSSGAMVGLMISLAKEGLIEPTVGIAVMMGAELGTCSDTLIATIGGRREAVRLAIFNVFFNVLAITIGLIFYHQFVSFIDFLFPAFSWARKIANAHIIFNIIGVVIVLPFITLYVKFIYKMIPYSRSESNFNQNSSP